MGAAVLFQFGRTQIFFIYLPNIRKVIHTANAIELLNSVIRQAIRKGKLFPMDDAVRKII